MKLLIVADEPAARSGLIRLCESVPDIRVVGEANTGATALRAAASLRPDLMFLDAELPDMSGLEVLRMLRRRQQRRTILVTANAQDVSVARAAGAIDHLLKPVNEAAFCACVMRARTCTTPHPIGERRPLFLIGEREHRLYPLDPFEIDYVQSAGNYVIYHVAGVEYIARESIKKLDEMLAPAGFVRIERSLLLNVRAISFAQTIGRGSFAFTLTTGALLHSGYAYRDTILAVLPLRRRTPGRIRTADGCVT